MVSVAIYINGKKLDLFDDENIDINSSVQKINDLGRVFGDYSQQFTVPASNNNNAIFKHYYDVDIDSTFNANIRQPAFIEIGTFEFKIGLIQLMAVVLKSGFVSHYKIQFYGNLTNLKELFGDDELSVLDFSHLDHEYNEYNVFRATRENNIANGSIYYPLISSVRNFEAGTLNSNDILTNDGSINFTDLKPAIQLYEIIKAIEIKYSINFTHTFFERSAFTKLYMWLHNTQERLKVLGSFKYIDLPSNMSNGPIVLNSETNTITYSGLSQARTVFQIMPLTSFDDTEYNFVIEVNGVDIISGTAQGESNIEFISTNIQSYIIKFKIKSSGGFQFTSRVSTFGLRPNDTTVYLINSPNPEQTLIGGISVSEHIPKMTVFNFLGYIVKEYNMVIVPITTDTFDLIPLDDWYNKGKVINITEYIDSTNVTVNRPSIFKQIDFKYENSGTIQGEKFRTNQGGVLGYGDLSAKYDVDGETYTIQIGFENMLFERLKNINTRELTNIQVGKSIDKDLKPYLGKPFIFYKNGFQFYQNPIKAKNFGDLNYTFLTGTENSGYLEQVTGSVNFSTDISTFLFAEINRNLYFNYWSDYISDIYSKKRRMYNYDAILPVSKLTQIKLNDILIVQNRPFIINNMKTGLTTGKTSFELLNYIGPPLSSIDSNIPLTADTIDYSADNAILSADMTYLHIAEQTSIYDGIELNSITATPAAESFDVKFTTGRPYFVLLINTGFGTEWAELKNEEGTKTDYVIINVYEFPSAITNTTIQRSLIVRFVSGNQIFDLTLIQRQ